MVPKHWDYTYKQKVQSVFELKTENEGRGRKEKSCCAIATRVLTSETEHPQNENQFREHRATIFQIQTTHFCDINTIWRHQYYRLQNVSRIETDLFSAFDVSACQRL